MGSSIDFAYTDLFLANDLPSCSPQYLKLKETSVRNKPVGNT